ncbi:MAG TPA: hypothetical protein PK230_04110 [Chitinophagales bacterium]|nr:hypothetical protein [Chitinophagales bacterium]
MAGAEMSGSDLRNISFNKAKHILNSIRQNTWDEISKAGFLSPRTYYRYKKFFKAFGIGEVASDKQIAVGSNGFQEYYDEINRNNHTISTKGLFQAPF